MIRGLLIIALGLYLADLSLKATQRHAHDLFIAQQMGE